MEEKLKKKRRRTIALIIVVVAIIGAVIAGLNFEYADYGDVLAEKVSDAEKLLENADVGNKKGQYAKYTLLDFQAKIDKANETVNDDKAEYDKQKAAYETMKANINEFKDSVNKDCLTADEIKSLMKDNKSQEKTIALSDSDNLIWKIDGSKITKAKDINLMAKLEGPYKKKISKYLEELKLQGATISFYHDGSFGGKLTATIPIYSEDDTTGYVYKYNVKKNTLVYVTDARIKVVENREKGSGDATAAFEVTSGGDYVVLIKDTTKNQDGNGKTTLDKDDVEKAEIEKKILETSNEDANKSSKVEDTPSNDDKTSNDSNISKEDVSDNDNTPSDNSDSSGGDDTIKDGDNTDGDEPEEDDKISVTITIQNTTYSGHRNSIIPKMTYKCEDGSTVYDVLYAVTRNKGIQMESEYTAAYGSYYVSAIDGLYEFDGGPGSGWQYRVNGAYPNYGCSSYTLKGGENIVWTYTCDFGNDI